MVLIFFGQIGCKCNFKACALNLATDGPKDHLIHCLKDGSTCVARVERLNNQLKVIESEEYNDVNPFSTVTEEDVENVAQPFHL